MKRRLVLRRGVAQMGNYNDYVLPSIGLVVGILSVIYIMTIMVNVFQTTNDIDNSPCRDITVVDKFSSVRGGAFSSNTFYYITDNKNQTYEMWISGNMTEISEWNRIIIGNKYNIRASGSDATFCNSQRLLF